MPAQGKLHNKSGIIDYYDIYARSADTLSYVCVHCHQHHCYRKCPTSKKPRGASTRRVSQSTSPADSSSPGLTGQQLRPHSQGCITPQLSSSTSRADADDWSETDTRQDRAFYSSEPVADICFQTIPRDSEQYSGAMLLGDAAQLSFNDFARNPLGSQSRPQKTRFNQLPGIDSIQR